MLQELAINIFQSEHEYIHRIDFEELESVKRFKKELERIQSPSINDGLKGVMIAFYFQEVKKVNDDQNKKELDENYAIEFLHKSLMEYMVAEYIWENMQMFLDKNSRTSEYVIDDNKKALNIIWKLFSPKMLSHEVLNNLINIIKNFEEQDSKNELADRLSYFLNYFLEKDFIDSYTVDDIKAIEKSMSSFYGYWNFLQSLREKNNVTEKNRNQIVYFLKCFKSIYPENYLDISNSSFKNVDFSNMNFENINMENTDFTRVSMLNSIMIDFSHRNVNMSLNDVQLDYSDVWKLKLKKVDIEDISFLSASITYLELADLSAKKLNFTDSSSFGCSFFNVDFYDCTFKNATFRTDIDEETIFRDVNFIACSFENTIFHNVQFIDCSIKDKKSLEDLGAIVIDCTFKDN